MTNQANTTNPTATPNSCCGACDCTNCTCGCAQGACRCQAANCKCGCRSAAR